MRKNEYTPHYPRTIDEAILMSETMHDEDDTDSDFMNGYRMGLRIGINQLETLKRRMK